MNQSSYQFIDSVIPPIPRCTVVKNLSAKAGVARDAVSFPGLGRSPGEGNGNPLQNSCLGNSKDRRSLVGYSPWGCKELDMTEHTHTMYCIKEQPTIHNAEGVAYKRPP